MNSINFSVLKTIRYMVYDLDKPFRGFSTKEEAEAFASIDADFKVVAIPKTIKKIFVEDAPF